MRNAGLDQDRFGSRLRRVIAFVADAGNLIAKPQGKQNLGSRRQQRANLHAPQFTTEMILASFSLVPGICLRSRRTNSYRSKNRGLHKTESCPACPHHCLEAGWYSKYFTRILRNASRSLFQFATISAESTPSTICLIVAAFPTRSIIFGVSNFPG